MNSETRQPRIPLDKQKLFIGEFEKIRPVYVEFARFLETILMRYINSLSILAIVQARPKSVISFSNKIILKDKYQDPLKDMTDLCGARVIVHFQSQVEKICDFIKNNFEIDEANSLDLKSRLKVNEFGYRSVHYIVTPKMDSILGVPVDDTFKSLKAEIQVRTLAEHMWTDISHDRIYKTDLNIPDEWKREAARLSAMLENADITFAKMSMKIDSVASVYELQYKAEKAPKDIEKLKTLIKVMKKEQDKGVSSCLLLSSIYRSMDHFDRSVELLRPYIEFSLKNQVLKGKLWFEYGMVLALSSGSEIESPSFSEGIRFIRHAFNHFEGLDRETIQKSREELSYLYYRYGRLLLRNKEESNQVTDCFVNAYNMMPDNPLYLVSLTEVLVLQNIEMARHNLSLFRANLGTAILRIQQLIGMGIECVPAWFAIGHCHFLLEDEKGCIDAYANAVNVILDRNYLTSKAILVDEITLIRKIKAINPHLSSQISRYLNIAMFLISEGKEHTRFRNILEEHRIRKEPFHEPVVIVAGGASRMDESKVEQYSECIHELERGISGTIISGGTTAGIPGLIGKEKMKCKDTIRFELLAYLPQKLPRDAIKFPAYDHFYETESDHFSALDIFSCWNDLVVSGTNPSDVLLIGIEGGQISSMEYKVALSLGAKVGLINYSGRSVFDLLQDNNWKDHPGLMQLPKDPYTLWALVSQSAGTMLTSEETETLAKIVHALYRQEKLKDFNHSDTDINNYKVVMTWDHLDPNLKKSNILQVAFYEHLLKRVNAGIRKADPPALINIKNNFSPEMYDLLACLEHARWNVERLLEGWKYGPVKDLSRKINPNLVSWDQLDPEVRKYDYEPVDNIPILLARIGYEIYLVDSVKE